MRAVLASMLAGLVFSAQQQPPPPVFRGGANLVRVDVTVTDKHGEPVGDLTADDFDIQEDNIPQAVETFKLVSADGRPVEGDDTSLEIRSPEHAAAEAARDDVRVFLIFWDEYHIGRFAPAIMGRKAVSDFVRTAFGPTDLVALMDPLTPVDAIRWTRNFGDLAEKVQKLEGRFGVYTPVRSVLEEGQLGRGVERLRLEVTVSAVKSAASYLGGLREGRKAIIFVSQGLPGIFRADEISILDDLVRTANNNNTALYTVNPAGLTGGRSDELRVMSENTGATAIVNSNLPVRAMRQIVRDASAFYLLGYASTQNPADGKFHQIKVRVKRSGLTLHARKGYWAPRQSDMDKAARDAAAAPPDNVAAAVATLSAARPERLVDFWAGATGARNGAGEVTLTWTPRPGQALPRDATVAVVVSGAGGARTVEAAAADRQMSFAADAGTLQLQVTVRNADGQTLGEEMRSVVVPDVASAALGITSPTIVVVRNPSELKNLTARTTPVGVREFARTDRLFIRFSVFGSAASDAVVSAKLLSKGGAALVTLQASRPADLDGAYQIDLPLASIARGDYVVEVTAVAGDDHAETLMALRVVS
jgi:VWFA-related protein